MVRPMKYPTHVMAIKPGYRWESGRRHVGFLRVEGVFLWVGAESCGKSNQLQHKLADGLCAGTLLGNC